MSNKYGNTAEVEEAIAMSARTGDPYVTCIALVARDRAWGSPEKTSGPEIAFHLRQHVTPLHAGGFDLREVRPFESDSVEVDPVAAGVRLAGPARWSDGTPKKLTWVKIAEVGAWKGHPAGEFEMTPATFSEICKNFERRGLPIQWDLDHTSELPAEQIDPRKGSPAHGWAHKLANRGSSGLFALTEWLDTARDGIKAGNFLFCSPAIRFDSTDTVTGARIGARLTSIAIVNQPFLQNLGRLRAAKDRPPPAKPKVSAEKLPESYSTLTMRLMSDRGLRYVDACAEAARLLAGGK